MGSQPFTCTTSLNFHPIYEGLSKVPKHLKRKLERVQWHTKRDNSRFHLGLRQAVLRSSGNCYRSIGRQTGSKRHSVYWVWCIQPTAYIQWNGFCFLVLFSSSSFGCPKQHAGSQFPNQGSNLHPLYWRHGGLMTGWPGKSQWNGF